LSGEEASFLVGGEVPVVKVTSSSSGDTVAEDVEYKEYGVKLNIQPVVLDGDDIKLNVTTEVKELTTEGQYVRADNTTIRAFATRSTSTVLRLKDGQSVVVSGLFKDKVTNFWFWQILAVQYFKKGEIYNTRVVMGIHTSALIWMFELINDPKILYLKQQKN